MTNIHVTHENFEDVLLTVVLGNIQFQNYSNQTGISTGDLQLANHGATLLEQLVNVVIDSGNSIYTMVQPTFLKFDYDCDKHYDEKEFAHITEITPFNVEIPRSGRIFSVCENVEASVDEDYATFRAENKYR